ncbi:helix-turn-helix domain-containing protein [Vallicoccus soli]|uniref:XRE family transcriptional regulator n=1 Tax=Vallicoccus soli TaxID=2339232 RepID=A0A3A3Z0F0_9ACTN|nr:helix-turn-helix transcriptional regulator [Vallicoccus soli]RJK97730.1 XRE family transcriptional regulator [Vallicoccus soli]
MARIDVGSLGSLQGSVGDYIREQRRSAQWSLRQLADAAGVSNPYLSQIERGLRKPSAEILQQIAKALRISAETLYVRAGFLEEREGGHEVVTAILADPVLTQRQKRVLLDIHASFRREALSEAAGAVDEPTADPEDPAADPAGPADPAGTTGTTETTETTGPLEDR